MMTGLFDSSPLPMLEQVVKFTEARHGVLAGNLANLDTPGYRVRDLPVDEFRTQLKEAMEERQSLPISQAPYPTPVSPGAQLTSSSSAKTRREDKLASVAEHAKGMLRHDDNNSSLEEQVTEIAKNQAEFNMAVSLMNAQFRMLRAAITERA
jgi:flagellar basal-body rod protein FlgB